MVLLPNDQQITIFFPVTRLLQVFLDIFSQLKFFRDEHKQKTTQNVKQRFIGNEREKEYVRKGKEPKPKLKKTFTCSLGGGKDQIRISLVCHFIHINCVFPAWKKFTYVH